MCVRIRAGFLTKSLVAAPKRPETRVFLFFFFEFLVLILKHVAFVDFFFRNRRRFKIENVCIENVVAAKPRHQAEASPHIAEIASG